MIKNYDAATFELLLVSLSSVCADDLNTYFGDVRSGLRASLSVSESFGFVVNDEGGLLGCIGTRHSGEAEVQIWFITTTLLERAVRADVFLFAKELRRVVESFPKGTKVWNYLFEKNNKVERWLQGLSRGKLVTYPSDIPSYKIAYYTV